MDLNYEESRAELEVTDMLRVSFSCVNRKSKCLDFVSDELLIKFLSKRQPLSPVFSRFNSLMFLLVFFIKTFIFVEDSFWRCFSQKN